MEYLTMIKSVLNIISTILILIYACILIKKHFVDHKKVTNEELLMYLILLSLHII